jgi:hypothetical protein
MKVWVVETQYWDEERADKVRHVAGLYSSRDKAQSAIDAFLDYWKTDDFYIGRETCLSEHEIDHGWHEDFLIEHFYHKELLERKVKEI